MELCKYYRIHVRSGLERVQVSSAWSQVNEVAELKYGDGRQ